MFAVVIFGGLVLAAAAVYGKNRAIQKVYGIWLVFCTAMGAGGIILLRPLLAGNLMAHAERFAYFEGGAYDSFDRWALHKFDLFFMGSLIFTVLAVGLLLWVLRRGNREGFIGRHFLGVSYFLMFLLLAASAIYGLNTINKLFDLASWIGLLAWAACGVLHLPLYLFWKKQS